MKISPVDFYVDKVNKIVGWKLSKARHDSLRSLFINIFLICIVIGILVSSIGIAYHFFIKDERIITKIEEKEIIVKEEVNNPIILDDGTKILRNGTIIKPDGSVVTSMDNLIADISDAATSKNITGAQSYVLFVEEEVNNTDETIAVNTGYRFNLGINDRHPTDQWCYYDIGNGLSKFIAEISNRYTVDKDEFLGSENEYLINGCKWITPKVTNHLLIVDESEIPDVLKNKVRNAMQLFTEYTGITTEKVMVNYGHFDQPEDEDTLGTCFIGGVEMQISVEHLKSASNKYVSAVVFHELGHCLLGLEHNNNPDHIMSASINDAQLGGDYSSWAAELMNSK